MSRSTTKAANPSNSDIADNSDVSTESVEIDLYATIETNTDGDDIYPEWVKSYKAAENNTDRAIVRKDANAAFKAFVRTRDMVAANTMMTTIESFKADAAKTDTVSVSSQDVLTARIVTLVLAARNVATGRNVPNGLDVADAEYDAFAHIVTVLDGLTDSFNSDLVSELSDSADKVGSSKITRSSEKHDIADVVRNAFNGASAGDVLKISEVRLRGGFDGYVPSPGAIRAHMEGKSPVSGFTLLSPSGDMPYSIRYDG